MLSRRRPASEGGPHRFAAVLGALALAIASLPSSARSKGSPESDKDQVWNYDGGIFFATDGSVTDGPCFRVRGKVTAPAFFDRPKHVTVFAERGYPIVLAPLFFDGMKRIDREGHESMFRRGNETMTQYPDELLMLFTMHDLPCSLELKDAPTGAVLTREMVDSFRYSLWWKDGVELHPVRGPKVLNVSLRALVPSQVLVERGIPQIYEWGFSLLVPSAKVPLTDSLVLIIREPKGRIAARVAARM
jgi:hypothetical protein